MSRPGAAVVGALAGLALGSLTAVADAQSRPGAPNPMCPHLDTWNARGIKGPNKVDHIIVTFPAGSASQRGGTCSIIVDASYERERERSYSFMAAGQFLINERFSRSSDRDSAVSGTRAFFLFPRPRWLVLEPRAQGGQIVVRLDPVRVVQIDSRGQLSRMTGAVLEQDMAITVATRGGVTFKQFEGIVLDAGWGRGEVAFMKNRDAVSTFTDRSGRTCEASNRDLFNYADPYRPVLAFGSDLELSRFLAGRCGAEFDVGPLVVGPRRADHSVFSPPGQVPPPPPRPQPRSR
jgi:hypothetical protein